MTKVSGNFERAHTACFRYELAKKICSGFSIRCYRKTRANFLAKPVFFFFKLINLFIYFWLCWVFVSVRGLSPVAASGGHSSAWYVGLFTIAASLVAEHRLQMRRLSNCGSRAQLLRSMWDPPRPGPEPVSPCISRQILNHCTTREAPNPFFSLSNFHISDLP